MLASLKERLSRTPILGYALHWLADLATLPLVRLDLLRDLRTLTAQQAETALQVEQLTHQIAQFHDTQRTIVAALSQINQVYDRLVLPDGEVERHMTTIGEAEARADLLRQLWALERRLANVERKPSA